MTVLPCPYDVVEGYVIYLVCPCMLVVYSDLCRDWSGLSVYTERTVTVVSGLVCLIGLVKSGLVCQRLLNYGLCQDWSVSGC